MEEGNLYQIVSNLTRSLLLGRFSETDGIHYVCLQQDGNVDQDSEDMDSDDAYGEQGSDRQDCEDMDRDNADGEKTDRGNNESTESFEPYIMLTILYILS